MEAETVYMRESHSYFPMSRWKRKTQGAEVWKKNGTFCIWILFFQSSNGMNSPSMYVGQSIFPALPADLFRHYGNLGLLYLFL